MAHELTLPAVPSSVPAARRFVQEALSDIDEGLVAWTAALLVSELVTNAMLHARTQVTVVVSGDGDGPVLLEVRDGSVRLPQVRGYGAQATTGRGLRLVQDLASRWGVHTSAAGKTVWVELDRGAALDPERGRPDPGDDPSASVAGRSAVPGSSRVRRHGVVSAASGRAVT